MLHSQIQAALYTDQIMHQVCSWLIPGVCEIDIAHYIKTSATQYGCRLSFDTLVASGSRAARFHARPTQKRIQSGEMVFVDFGLKFEGYCSDITRTFFIGRPTSKQKEVYHVVLEAQRRAIKKVKAGVAIADIDHVARKYITQQGLGHAFPHSTGHGIRKRVHVAPRIHVNTGGTLHAGEVITIEPGVYLKGWGGIRIEDMLWVTDTGFELLTHSPKTLEAATLRG